MKGKRSIKKAVFKAQHDAEFRNQRKLNKRQQKQVKSIIRRGQELKYFVFPQTPIGVTSGGSLTGIPFDIPQSAGASTDTSRIGDSIMWCGSIDFRLQITNGLGVTSDQYNNVRVVIFQWHDTSTATPFPIVSNIFINGPSGSPDVYSQYNHDYRHEYKILFDRTFTTVSGNSAANTTQPPNLTINRNYKISLKKARKNVQYVGGSGQGSNRLFIFYISDSALATHPSIIYTTKVFFRDS